MGKKPTVVENQYFLKQERVSGTQALLEVIKINAENETLKAEAQQLWVRSKSLKNPS
jgi:hypothetical protein